MRRRGASAAAAASQENGTNAAKERVPFGSGKAKYKNAGRSSQPSMCKFLLGLMLTSPSLILIALRLPDFALFDVHFNTTVSPAAIYVAFIFWSMCIVRFAARKPWLVGLLSILAGLCVKHYADHVPAPLLTCGPTGRCTTLVTGANSGIGLALAQTLAAQGHRVLMACRSRSSCDDARQAVIKHASSAKGAKSDGAVADDLALRIHALPGLELGNPRSIESWIDTLLRSRPGVKLDIAFNNAGFVPVGNQSTSPFGLEMGFGVSHLGHFKLVADLREAHAFRHGATVVQVSSDASRLGAFHSSIFEGAGEGDLRGEKTVGCAMAFPFCLPPVRIEGLRRPSPLAFGVYGFGGYTRAKLANVLYARRLSTVGAEAGGELTAASVYLPLPWRESRTRSPLHTHAHLPCRAMMIADRGCVAHLSLAPRLPPSRHQPSRHRLHTVGRANRQALCMDRKHPGPNRRDASRHHVALAAASASGGSCGHASGACGQDLARGIL